MYGESLQKAIPHGSVKSFKYDKVYELDESEVILNIFTIFLVLNFTEYFVQNII